MYGKTHSDEAKRKLSVAGKGRPAWNKGKVMVNLTDTDMIEIRRLHDEGLSYETIAQRYDCSDGTIRRVVLCEDCFSKA
jgi:Mor family transcriptional regulator